MADVSSSSDDGMEFDRRKSRARKNKSADIKLRNKNSDSESDENDNGSWNAIISTDEEENVVSPGFKINDNKEFKNRSLLISEDEDSPDVSSFRKSDRLFEAPNSTQKLGGATCCHFSSYKDSWETQNDRFEEIPDIPGLREEDCKNCVDSKANSLSEKIRQREKKDKIRQREMRARNYPDIPDLRCSGRESFLTLDEIGNSLNQRERELDNDAFSDIPDLGCGDRENSIKQQTNEETCSRPYTGTRPKVYMSGPRSPEPRENHVNNFNPRNPTKLPDFVQDHLVIEDSYMKQRPKLNKLYFDLAESVNKRKQPTKDLPIPEILDLPVFGKCNEQPTNSPEFVPPPNDRLPKFEPNEVLSKVTKSLPDFLNDGLILNNRTEPMNRSESPAIQISREEYDRLRLDLEIARRSADERMSRIMTLEFELESRRKSEMAKRAEESEEQNMRRIPSTLSTMSSLREQIRSLQNEMSLLRIENTELRMAVGFESSGKNQRLDRKISVVANDLRTAASTAEASLRQLMSGVSNLRVLASALENMDKIEDRTKDFLPEFDDDNAAGPAL